MLGLLESGNEGDLCITVGNTQFSVFKSLVARCAPTIGDMVASQPSGANDSIEINDVDPELFSKLLHFIYTDEMPENVDHRQLLEVADRFGCSHLKLAAEAELVMAGVDSNNAAELLLFAEGHSCALLQEAAFEYCAAHPLAIKESEGWNLLKESPLCLELVGAAPTLFSETDIDSMQVATLRRKLDEKGLDMDGTRETLIRRLKESE
jgi:speckle-type POZ protein